MPFVTLGNDKEKLDRQDVVDVIEVFRAEGCSMLMPAGPAALADAAIIDISHESLIRQWKRLKDWAQQHTTSRSASSSKADAHQDGTLGHLRMCN